MTKPSDYQRRPYLTPEERAIATDIVTRVIAQLDDQAAQETVRQILSESLAKRTDPNEEQK